MREGETSEHLFLLKSGQCELISERFEGERERARARARERESARARVRVYAHTYIHIHRAISESRWTATQHDICDQYVYTYIHTYTCIYTGQGLDEDGRPRNKTDVLANSGEPELEWELLDWEEEQRRAQDETDGGGVHARQGKEKIVVFGQKTRGDISKLKRTGSGSEAIGTDGGVGRMERGVGRMDRGFGTYGKIPGRPLKIQAPCGRIPRRPS
jgi:hypothetical protein